MWPFDQVGQELGSSMKEMASSAFADAMRALWEGSLFLLRESFILADRFSVFTVDTQSGPIGALWPMMLWLSGILAVGLFFWQLMMSNLRGGRGFMRVITGPVQYGVALSVTVGTVAALLAATDAITHGILVTGLNASNFQDALNHHGLLDDVSDHGKAIVMGLVALFGVLPASFGYILEMIFREAAIYLLVATVPITAAGMLAESTASWYWRTLRWLMAAIAMKPVLALALVLGVTISGEAQGLSGTLAGVGVLLISVFCPFVLFKLFAFVDPNTDSGSGFRDAFSSATGISPYGSPGGGSSDDAGDGGGGAQEDATQGRFDKALADTSTGEADTYGIGHSNDGSGSSSGDSDSDSRQDRDDDAGDDDGPEQDRPPPDDDGPDGPNGGGGGPSGGGPTGGGPTSTASKGGKTAEAEEVAGAL